MERVARRASMVEKNFIAAQASRELGKLRNVESHRTTNGWNPLPYGKRNATRNCYRRRLKSHFLPEATSLLLNCFVINITNMYILARAERVGTIGEGQ